QRFEVQARVTLTMRRLGAAEHSGLLLGLRVLSCNVVRWSITVPSPHYKRHANSWAERPRWPRRRCKEGRATRRLLTSSRGAPWPRPTKQLRSRHRLDVPPSRTGTAPRAASCTVQSPALAAS